VKAQTTLDFYDFDFSENTRANFRILRHFPQGCTTKTTKRRIYSSKQNGKLIAKSPATGDNGWQR
jgi:hypothetical protein